MRCEVVVYKCLDVSTIYCIQFNILFLIQSFHIYSYNVTLYLQLLLFCPQVTKDVFQWYILCFVCSKKYEVDNKSFSAIS